MQLETATPLRSMEQRMTALAHANEIRTYRRIVKQRLRDGDATFVEMLTADDPLLATMRVYDLLLAVPLIGVNKAQRLMIRHRVAMSKTVGGLSERQRDCLTYSFLGNGRPRVGYETADVRARMAA